MMYLGRVWCIEGGCGVFREGVWYGGFREV